MDDTASRSDALRDPTPLQVWWWRVWMVLVVALTVWITIGAVRGGATSIPGTTPTPSPGSRGSDARS